MPPVEVIVYPVIAEFTVVVSEDEEILNAGAIGAHGDGLGSPVPERSAVPQ